MDSEHTNNILDTNHYASENSRTWIGQIKKTDKAQQAKLLNKQTISTESGFGSEKSGFIRNKTISTSEGAKIMKDRHDSINNNHSDEEEESRKSNLTNKADKPLGTDTFEMR